MFANCHKLMVKSRIVIDKEKVRAILMGKKSACIDFDVIRAFFVGCLKSGGSFNEWTTNMGNCISNVEIICG